MKGQWEGGKGSGRRSSADDKAYADNWDKIFGKDQKIKQKQVTELNWDGDENESNTQIQSSRK